MSSDKVITWFLLGMWTIAMLAGGAGIGHRQMKRWQDEWYAAHPVIQEVSLGSADVVLGDCRFKVQAGTFIYLPLDTRGCAPTPGPTGILGNKCWKDGKVIPCRNDDYLRGYRDATNYCVASIKKKLKQPEVKPVQLEQMPSLGEAREFDGQQYIWNGREWMAILKGGGVRNSICWGDTLIKDGEDYDICVPPLYRKDHLEQILSEEKRLYDEGWYQPMLIGAAQP